LSGTASAQMPVPGINLAPNPDRPPLTPEEQQKQQAREEAYKSALQKIPNKDDKKRADPWANMRAEPPTAPKTK
jgi:hypothetical protein